MRRLRQWLGRAETRLGIAWAQFWVAWIGWPLSLAITDEPPFILSLSWWAIIATAWDTINTTELKKETT